jgi:hypothetical protein
MGLDFDVVKMGGQNSSAVVKGLIILAGPNPTTAISTPNFAWLFLRDSENVRRASFNPLIFAPIIDSDVSSKRTQGRRGLGFMTNWMASKGKTLFSDKGYTSYHVLQIESRQGFCFKNEDLNAGALPFEPWPLHLLHHRHATDQIPKDFSPIF